MLVLVPVRSLFWFSRRVWALGLGQRLEFCCNCDDTGGIPDGMVTLTLTSVAPLYYVTRAFSDWAYCLPLLVSLPSPFQIRSLWYPFWFPWSYPSEYRAPVTPSLPPLFCFTPSTDVPIPGICLSEARMPGGLPSSCTYHLPCFLARIERDASVLLALISLPHPPPIMCTKGSPFESSMGSVTLCQLENFSSDHDVFCAVLWRVSFGARRFALFGGKDFHILEPMTHSLCAARRLVVTSIPSEFLCSQLRMFSHRSIF